MRFPKSAFKISSFLAVSLVVVSLFSVDCKKKAPPPPPPPPVPTPVVPPGSLVFVQRGHLVRLDLESSQITPLTSGKSTEWFPACSPKGDQVVYWSNVEGVYNLWKRNVDGTGPIQLTFEENDSLQTSDQNLRVNAAASWAPDGKRILYAIDGDIWIMDADGYNPETVLLQHNAICPFITSDGKIVYYLSNADDMVYNLWALNVSEKTVKKITNYTDWNIGSPSLSMDGKKILFNLYRANLTQVYTVNSSDGSDPVNITNNNRSLCPKYALNDKKIVYCAFGTGEDVSLNLFMVNSNGTETKTLTTEGGSSPSWAPRYVMAPVVVLTPSTSLPTPVGK